MPTVDAQVLIGRFDRDQAIQYLCSQCDFGHAVTEAEAEAMWLPYRQRIDQMPDRIPALPTRHPIPPQHDATVQSFLARCGGPEVLDVVNLNPMELVVYQLYVVVDRANEHANNTADWTAKTLVVDRPPCQMPIRMDNGVLKLTLPHAEHMFSLCPDGAFRVQQGAAFVSVVEADGRLILKAGYHRSFGFSRALMNAPDANEKSALVALTTTLPPQLSAPPPHHGLRTMVFGSKPPLFSDFFDPAFAMTVPLRKKTFEFHISASLQAIDAP